MSQEFYFYKQKILPEEIAQLFSPEKVHNAVKALLAEQDLEQNTELRQKLFEEIDLNLIDISAYDTQLEDLLKSTEFIPSDSKRFMMNKKIWAVIQKIVLSQYNESESDREKQSGTEGKPDEQLKKLREHKSVQLLTDYSILEELFKKNLLFVNIQ